MKKLVRRMILAIGLSTLFPLISVATVFGAQQPNIIFIVTDDHGYNDLEATDLRDEVSMPNVHRLSTHGALMTQVYSSRCSLTRTTPSVPVLMRRRAVDTSLSAGIHLSCRNSGTAA